MEQTGATTHNGTARSTLSSRREISHGKQLITMINHTALAVFLSILLNHHALANEKESGHAAQLEESASNQTPQAVTEETFLTYDELPVSIRREHPRPRVSIHYYTEEASERYVYINGFSAREGLPIGRELWVHEIRPEGVVLKVQNYYILVKN